MRRPWRVEYTSGPVEDWQVLSTHGTQIAANIKAALQRAAHPGITYRVEKHVEFEAKK